MLLKLINLTQPHEEITHTHTHDQEFHPSETKLQESACALAYSRVQVDCDVCRDCSIQDSNMLVVLSPLSPMELDGPHARHLQIRSFGKAPQEAGCPMEVH